MYGRYIPLVFNLQHPLLLDRLLVAEEDGSVFCLVVGVFEGGAHDFDILCVRNNAHPFTASRRYIDVDMLQTYL